MKKSLFLLCLALINSANIFAAEANERPYVIAVPGLGGGGDDAGYIGSTFLPGQIQEVRVAGRPNPPIPCSDLGQKNCMQFITQAKNKLPSGSKYIFYSSSQGGAATFNDIISNNDPNLVAVVTEAALVSPNSAILHMVQQVPIVNWLTCIPGSRYCLPYGAKILFWTYSPTGQNPINGLDKIQNKEMPFYIMHNEGDTEVPFSNGLALLYALKKNGHKNVYLSTRKSDVTYSNPYYKWHPNTGSQHVSIRGEDDNTRIQAMLNNRPQEELLDEANLMRRGKAAYEELIRDERRTKYGGYFLGASIGIFAYYKVSNWFPSIKPNNLLSNLLPFFSFTNSKKS